MGAVQNWVELQNSGENVIWSIVDMHSITLPHVCFFLINFFLPNELVLLFIIDLTLQNPTELRENVLKLTATLLACGIDPEKSILFQQSSVSMHAELAWIFACLATMPRLARQPQFKEKSENIKDVPLGLYIYPVLQTADILLYK